MASWSCADSGVQSVLVETFRALQAIGDASSMHCQDGVADKRQLGEIAGTKKNAATAFGEDAGQPVDLRLRGNGDPLGRLFEQKHADFAGEPLGQNNLLLIAAGARRRGKACLARAGMKQL